MPMTKRFSSSVFELRKCIFIHILYIINISIEWCLGRIFNLLEILFLKVTLTQSPCLLLSFCGRRVQFLKCHSVYDMPISNKITVQWFVLFSSYWKGLPAYTKHNNVSTTSIIFEYSLINGFNSPIWHQTIIWIDVWLSIAPLGPNLSQPFCPN